MTNQTPQHTPVPIEFDGQRLIIKGQPYRLVLDDMSLIKMTGEESLAVAERLKSSYNACAGIANPEALPKLLKAISNMLERFDKHGWERVIGGYITDCERALAKLEGNQ